MNVEQNIVPVYAQHCIRAGQLYPWNRVSETEDDLEQRGDVVVYRGTNGDIRSIAESLLATASLYNRRVAHTLLDHVGSE